MRTVWLPHGGISKQYSPSRLFRYPQGVWYAFAWRRGTANGPHKEQLLKRLARIEGQVRGIAKMIEDDRYCIDILTQLGAVDTALEAVALKVLEEHVQHCVAGALASGDPEQAEREERGAARGRAAICEDAMTRHRDPLTHRGAGDRPLPDRLRDRRGARHGDRDRARLGQRPVDRDLRRARVLLRLRADAAAGRCAPGSRSAARCAGVRQPTRSRSRRWRSSTTRFILLVPGAIAAGLCDGPLLVEPRRRAS